MPTQEIILSLQSSKNRGILIPVEDCNSDPETDDFRKNSLQNSHRIFVNSQPVIRSQSMTADQHLMKLKEQIGEDGMLSSFGQRNDDQMAPISSRFAYINNIIDEAESDQQSSQQDEW